MDNIVAKYTLKYNDLASKRLRGTAAAARAVTKALKLAAVASTAIAVVGVAAAVRYANAWAETADEIGKFSKKTGVAVGQISLLRTAMELQGGAADDVQTGIETLNKRIGELRLGTGALYTILNKSNPAFAAQLKGAKTSGEAMELAIGFLAKLENAQDRAAISAALFGRTAGASFDLLTKDGVAALQALNAEIARVRPPLTPEQTKIAAAYNDQITLAKQAVLSLVDAGSGALLPTLTGLAKAFTELVASNRELINTKITDFVNTVSGAIKKIDFGKTMESLKGFGAGLLAVGAIGAKFVEMVGGPENAVKLFAASMVVSKIAPFVSIIGALGKGFMIAGPAILKLGGILKIIGTVALTAGKFLIPLITGIGIIPIAIGLAAAAVIAGVAWIINNFDKVKAFALSLGIDLDAFGAGVVSTFQWLKGMVGKIFTAIGHAIMNPVATAKATVTAHITVLSTIWKAVMDGLSSFTSAVWDGIKSVFETGVNFLIDMVNGLLDFYNSIASKVGLGTVQLFDKVGNAKSKAQSAGAGNPGGPRPPLTGNAPFPSRPNSISPFLSVPITAPPRIGANSTSFNSTVTLRAEKGTKVSSITGDAAAVNADGENFVFEAAA